MTNSNILHGLQKLTKKIILLDNPITKINERGRINDNKTKQNKIT